MRKRINAVPFIALCLSFPFGDAAAGNNTTFVGHPTLDHVTYSHRDDARLHAYDHHYYPRRHNSRQGYDRHHRPYRYHRRYYGWHGFCTPSWHYPRSFRYHRYGY